VRVVLVGAGKAGGSIALAAGRAGHEIVGVVSHGGDSRFGPTLGMEGTWPESDLLLIAVRDGDISKVAEAVSGRRPTFAVAAHLSGFVPVSALAGLVDKGVSTGGFHPLQTLPDPDVGADSLRGAYAGIDGDQLAVDSLTLFAESMGMRTFRLSDEYRPAYHAAAAAAANFVVTSLATAKDLFDSAGVDPAVVIPLVERVVANVFAGEPSDPLTGPIARGDLETVIGHLTAAHQVSDEVGAQFRLLAEATAIRAGRAEETRLWS